MSVKISPHKVSRMLELYFKGCSQAEIAVKLDVDQSTVSLYVAKIKYAAQHHGVKVAAEEVGLMHQVEALHSLAAELRKAKLTAGEAKAGLKMELMLQGLGIDTEDYKDVMQVCTKVKSEGVLPWAVKLSKLEHTTGMTYEDVVSSCAETHEELEKARQELEAVTGELAAAKEELAAIENQKEAAGQQLEAQMEQLGVDMSRLKLVEGLALALKQGGVSSKDLQGYIERQQLLNKAGIRMDTFASVLEKAEVATAEDHGTGLLGQLSAYGGLSNAIKDLEGKRQLLTKQGHGLEETAKLKGQLEAETVKLRTERAILEGNVAQLHVQKAELERIRGEATSVAEKKAKLDGQVAELETHKAQLSAEIKSREEKISNLAELEAKHAELTTALAEVETRLEKDKAGHTVFESFLGLVQTSSPSVAELEKFAMVLPGLVAEVKHGEYSPELLRSHLLEKLGGGSLQLLRCTSCQARFAADKAPKVGKPHCPVCGLSHDVTIDEDSSAIVKAALGQQAPPKLIVVQTVIPIPKQPKPHNDGSG